MAATSPHSVYVGKYRNGVKPALPEGVRGILIHTSDKTLGGALSPYILRDEHRCLLENVWQFSKVYERVDAIRTKLSRFHPDTIVWVWGAEIHVDSKGDLTPEYWEWREAGMRNPYAVRYPNGFKGRSRCLYSLHQVSPDFYEQLDYIQARKTIYCGLYERLAPSHPEFHKLQHLSRKTDLCIIEVDGPDVSWYTDTEIAYAIEGEVLRLDQTVIDYLVNDPSHPFGHGYVIGALLAGLSFGN